MGSKTSHKHQKNLHKRARKLRRSLIESRHTLARHQAHDITMTIQLDKLRAVVPLAQRMVVVFRWGRLRRLVWAVRFALTGKI